ncbi:MAG TPA: nitrilase-related carbon-nitrogen hydrolase, partial [Levilinea sp.]|nr:nitrilase-related carbon-nitrogen hydrolase [Levilinea sp.]
MSDLRLDEIIEIGSSSGHGSLLGVQPFMLASDYASAQDVLDKLDGYFAAAQAKGWLQAKTIVVLPEYLGAWLVAAGERPGIYAAENIQAAMRSLALSHLLLFGRAYLACRESDRAAAALFHMKAGAMAQDYQFIFSRLASRYGVTVVAGSILLPQPSVVNGILLPGSGPLQNISAVFGPDGALAPHLSRKVYPVKAELPFVAGAHIEDLPAFDTPAGRLGVLVCADTWYPAPYQRLRQLEIDLLAAPSLLSHGDWKQPWGGYNGAPAPPDVDSSDVGRLTEGEAWRKYALAGRIGLSGAQAGINVFL